MRRTLALLALAACTRAHPSAPDAAPPVDAAVMPRAKAKLLTVLGFEVEDRGFSFTRWTPGGAVVAILDDGHARRFWWTRPGAGEPSARTVPIPDETGVSGLVVAGAAEVAVVTAGMGIRAAGANAYVFRDGQKIGTFPLTRGASTQELSDDGTLLRTGSVEADEIYEVATGKRVLGVRSLSALSPGRGEWALGGAGIWSTRDGAQRMHFARTVSYARWVDGIAIGWSDAGLTIADPAGATEREIDAPCKEMEVDAAYDPVAKHAVRACAGKLAVVSVPDGALTVVPTSGRLADLHFADDGAILVRWQNGKVGRVDLAARKVTPLAALPPASEAKKASPDGKLLLDPGSALRIVDRDGHLAALWGLRKAPEAGPLGTFAHDGGLAFVPQLADPKLPGGVLARNGVRELKGGLEDVTYLEKGVQRGALQIGLEPEAAVFTEPGLAILAVRDVLEVKIPSLEIVARHPVELPRMEQSQRTLLATPRSFVAAVSTPFTVRGVVLPRDPDAGAGPRFQSWQGGGLAWLPDGRVELFGDVEPALLCLDEESGVVRPFAACRADLEVRGQFRVE